MLPTREGLSRSLLALRGRGLASIPLERRGVGLGLLRKVMEKKLETVTVSTKLEP
jgi:hypothetical protein